jgi:hypothetical protein
MVTKYLDFKPSPTLDQLVSWTGGGISRSTLHRHRSRCVPRVEEEQVKLKLYPVIGKTHNLLVRLGGEEWYQVPPIPGLPDLTIEMRYESAKPRHHVVIQDVFGRVEGEPEKDIFGNLPESPGAGRVNRVWT